MTTFVKSVDTESAPAGLAGDSPRVRLLQAAARLFKTKGYDRTTVRDLAKEVGIQSGSIFHHFSNKEEILKAVMIEAIHYNTHKMRVALEQATNTEEELLGLIICELESIQGHTGDAMSVLVFEWRALSEANQAEILQLREEYEQMWLRVIEAANSEGLTSEGSAFIKRRLLAGALSWTGYWYDVHGEMDINDLAREALKLIIK